MLATDKKQRRGETVRLNVRIAPELHRQLRIRAAERCTTSQEIVSKLLREHLSAPVEKTEK